MGCIIKKSEKKLRTYLAGGRVVAHRLEQLSQFAPINRAALVRIEQVKHGADLGALLVAVGGGGGGLARLVLGDLRL